MTPKSTDYGPARETMLPYVELRGRSHHLGMLVSARDALARNEGDPARARADLVSDFEGPMRMVVLERRDAAARELVDAASGWDGAVILKNGAVVLRGEDLVSGVNIS